MKRIATLVAGIALALTLLPSLALASGNPTCQSYSPQLCTVVSNASASRTTAATSATTATSSSTLPFTGLDVVFLAAGGATLLGAGLVVRRLSRSVD